MRQSLVYHRLSCTKSTGKYFIVTGGRGMSARNILPVRLVLIKPVRTEEFWPAIAILRFMEGI